ncbi:MAG: ribonuclease III [Candidatus Omnitrophica bacterium]|nr:ribonuclease III [Candidatus Omnitrophota bacterium]MDD5671302.1 ribonuclease III [Candidatus Omnitrophota bacterium]
MTIKSNKVLGISFRNAQLLKSALTHPSHRNEAPDPNLEDFDRLEFFGDAILNYVICSKLYRTYPQADEGMLSRLRSILVSRKILSRIAKEIKLPPHIRLGKSLSTQRISLKSKIFADSLESFLAAIYFDKGLKRTEQFILTLYRGYFDVKRLLRLDPNPKSTLQELSQKIWKTLPVYSYSPSGTGVKVTATVGKNRRITVQSKTRQMGEEKSARLLIQKIRQEFPVRSKRSSSGKKLRKTF